MSLTTISGEFPTVDPNGTPTNVPVQTISGPDTSHTPVTTRYLWGDRSPVDIFVTYTPIEGGSEYGPSTVTETLGATETNSATATSSTSRESAQSTSTETAAETASPETTTQTQSETPAVQPQSSPSSIKNGSGISNGALAGAIVASVVGTALLTLLLAFLFFRRRRAHPPKDLPSESHDISPTPDQKAGPLYSLAAITPHPADDDTIRTRILTILDKASLHVDNYYIPSSSPAHLSPDAIARLRGYNTADLPDTVDVLLSHRSIQRQIITHVLVRALLSGIRPDGVLLPGVMAHEPVVGGSNAETDSALFTWRMLTARLHAEATRDKTEDAIHPAARSRAPQDLAGDFSTAFEPYCFSGFTGEERVQHLATLAAETAELGVWLFGQPCRVEFRWGTGSASEFMVLPEIVKVGDEWGRRLKRGVVLADGEKAVVGKI